MRYVSCILRKDVASFSFDSKSNVLHVMEELYLSHLQRSMRYGHCRHEKQPPKYTLCDGGDQVEENKIQGVDYQNQAAYRSDLQSMSVCTSSQLRN